MPRIIAITGASSGIGLALAKELAKPGNHLILMARRTSILENLATEVRNAGGDATVHSIDFNQQNAWQEAYDSLLEAGFHIDTLYHCAARISAGAVHHTQPEDWLEIYRVNLLSATAILASLYPAMAKRREGTIVLFSSLTSLSGAPMSAPYGATKTALFGLWKNLQYESSRTGVSIHLVSPSFVDTPLFENFILRKITSQQVRRSMLATRLPITQPAIAARKIVAGVHRGKKYIIFPFQIALCAFLTRRFPAIGRHFVKQSTRAIGLHK